ncbi:hypothetical protein ONZ43_g4109 [Nemania bipapillata]|uniref:Uncharacterized protein n=1 Tax=Nemania bipapillata TaxID=110536 RepID=A0ACC2IRN4_9PEZI|nr:hypothetical protein ONZ43_g4109 [Nemania bipapillata]
MDDPVNETSILYQNIWCVYPISGTYTRFQRFMFYTTILVAFVFRFHQWLSSVAMGSVFVYSVVTAVHAIPLSTQPSLGADTDMIAVYSIVLTSLYCAVMARIYSPRFIGRNFNAFYNCWLIGLSIPAVLVTIGFVRCQDPCAAQRPEVLFRGGRFDGTTGVVLDSWWKTIPGDGNQTSTLGTPSIDGHVNGYETTPGTAVPAPSFLAEQSLPPVAPKARDVKPK